MIKECSTCGKDFHIPLAYKTNAGKFCSRKCYWISLRGKTPWNKGVSGIMPSGNKHHKWRGNKASYGTLHDWVSYHRGFPNVCEFCKKTEENHHKIHWANKSGRYTRKLDDWLRLCAKCHKAFDLSR